MRRLTQVIAALLLIVSLTACGTAQTAPKEDAPQASAQETAGTPAQTLAAAFRTLDPDSKTTEELADELVSNACLPFEGAVMPVEPGFLNGFAEEIEGFKEGACFAPMIGSIPFVGYVFRLEEAADAAAFEKHLKDKADLRWNVCTQADEMVCETVGQTVCFVIAPKDFDE